jgi:purine nucleosidase
MLAGLVLMCGRFFGGMGAEWNARGDPHATAVVFGAGHQTRPPHHTSFGLDVTTRCRMPADECRRRFTAEVLRPVRDFAEVWFRGRPAGRHGGRERPFITFHDPLAAACIFQPDLCRYRRGHVTVSLTPPTLGWTVFREGKAAAAEADTGAGAGSEGPAGRRLPPHTVACDVDPDRFFDHYFDVVKPA